MHDQKARHLRKDRARLSQNEGRSTAKQDVAMVDVSHDALIDADTI